MKCLPLLALVFLAGCFTAEQKNNKTNPVINNYLEEAKKEVTEKVKASVGEDAKKYTDSKVADSQNAIQQNNNALFGIPIGKLAEKLTGVDATLSNTIGKLTGIEATMNNTLKVADKLETKVGDVDAKLNNQITLTNKMEMMLTNQIKLTNDMRAEFTNTIGQIKTEFKSQVGDLTARLESEIKLNAELKARLDAQVSAQVGLSNKIDTVKTDLTAGRDSINTQFTDQMLSALRSANWVAIAICFGFVIMIILIMLILTRQHKKDIQEVITKERSFGDFNSGYVKSLVDENARLKAKLVPETKSG
jgi:hypothetical protein